MPRSIQYFLLLLLIAVAALAYLPILEGFFQQDEWIAFGNFFASERKSLIVSLLNSFAPSIGHYVPLHNLTFSVFFSFFRLNYELWALTSLGWHLIIVFLVFILATKFFHSNLALLAALLFGVSASGQQATSWAVADINTHGATFFGILSLISFFTFLKEKKERNFWASIIFLILSLLFKEIAIALFLVLPFAFYVFAGKTLASSRTYPALIFGVGLVYIGLRIVMFIIPGGSQTAPVVTQSQTLNLLVYNLTTFPLKGVTQTIIPSRQLLEFSYDLGLRLPDSKTGEKGTTSFDLFVQNKILEGINLLVFLLTAGVVLIAWKKNTASPLAKISIFALFFTMLNSAIYALSPERSGIVPLIDSRNLYFPAIGMSLFLVSLGAMAVKKNPYRVFVLLLPFFVLNFFWLNKELTGLAQVGSLRKSILAQIKSEYPDLPQRVVFYTESNKAYYGLPDEEKIMPFQSGFGQTLLVWYHAKEKFPKEFLQNRFLWEITDQGYRQARGRGFGYFRNLDLLAQTFAEYNIPIESVIAFSWEGERKRFSDITTEIVRKLSDENF